MDTALWILAGLLALLFGSGAIAQLALTKDRYRALGPGQHWVDDFTAEQIKAIGSIKLLGVAGLILPGLVGVLPVLTPLAASGLMLVMAGAATTRFRRQEWHLMPVDVAFMSACAFLAWGRFELAPL